MTPPVLGHLTGLDPAVERAAEGMLGLVVGYSWLSTLSSVLAAGYLMIILRGTGMLSSRRAMVIIVGYGAQYFCVNIAIWVGLIACLTANLNPWPMFVFVTFPLPFAVGYFLASLALRSASPDENRLRRQKLVAAAVASPLLLPISVLFAIGERFYDR